MQFPVALGTDLKNVQKEGRDEERKSYSTFAVYFLKTSGSLLAFFHLGLVSILFSDLSLTEMKLYRKYFL